MTDKIENENDGVLYGEWLLFPDGSISERNSYGITRSPPGDDYKRCGLIVKYWELKTKLAIQHFDNEKISRLRYASRLMGETRRTAPTERVEDATHILTELKRKVEFCREKLAEAEANLEKATPQTDKKLAEDMVVSMIQDYNSAIQKIEI